MSVPGGAPLRGRSVLVTRPRESSRELRRRLLAAGARVVELPLIAIRSGPTPELDQAMGRLESYDWIVFTSSHAVAAVWRRQRRLGRRGLGSRRLRIAVVGAATARALRRRGVRPDVVPRVSTARGLLSAFRGRVHPPSRILLPRSDLAPATLPDGLRRQGHEVHAVVAYRTVPGPRPGASLRRAAQAADAALFFSPSAVRQFGRLGLRAPRAVVACIGPTTAAAARRRGLRSPAVPAEPTPRALVATLERAFAIRDRR